MSGIGTGTGLRMFAPGNSADPEGESGGHGMVRAMPRPAHELLWAAEGAAPLRIAENIHLITARLGLWVPVGALPAEPGLPGGCRRITLANIGGAPQFAERPVPVEITPLLQLLLRRLQTQPLDERSRSLSEAMIVDVLQPAERDLRVCVPGSELLQPIVGTLRDDPANRLSLEQWAEQLGVSTKTITRSFRAETGLSFSRWRSAVRAQHAVMLLAAGAEIEEVARCSGYHSASAFRAAFRRVTGTTPGSFRPGGETASP